MSLTVSALPDLPVLAWFSKQIALTHCGTVARESLSPNGDRAEANRVCTLYRQMPTRTGAGFHLCGDRRGFGPEVFFENDPVLCDYEGLDP